MMKRAALSAASTSSAPPSTIGWFATIPTGRPPIRASPVIRLRAQAGLISKSRPWSTRCPITFFMSYARRALSGTRLTSASSIRSAGSSQGRTGGCSRFDVGKNERYSFTATTQARSSATSRSATPEISVCTLEPPSSSALTSSPTTALTSGGPPSAM